MAFGSLRETLYASTAVGATLASFTTEAQLNTGGTMGAQAKLPANFWTPSPTAVGRGIGILARGILSSTGTPTFQVLVRGGAAGNSTAIVLLGTPAMTTTSGAASQIWELRGEVVLNALGASGGTNSTVRGTGLITSPGFAPVVGSAYGGNSAPASPGTASNLNFEIDNYINVNVVCSVNSASNTFTLQYLQLDALN